MCELLDNGKVIFTGTYAQCLIEKAKCRAVAALMGENHTFTIRESTIDADGFTGYSL